MNRSTRNKVPPQKNQLHQQLELALQTLRQTAGLKGRVVATEARERQGHFADAIVEFLTENQPHRFAVEAKTRLDRMGALWVLQDHLERDHNPGLLFAPYVTHAIAQKCRELDIPFMDAAGNAYLRLPGLYVFIAGQKPEGEAFGATNVRGLDTATALRMVFGLLCRPELLDATYREIAQATGVALGAVGQVFRDLRKRGYLVVGPRKRHRRLVEPDRLFEEWVTNYPTKLRPKLNPQRFRAKDPHWWKTADIAQLNAQWGGEVAAHRLTKHLRPATVTVYVPTDRKRDVVTPLVARHKLRDDPAGDVDVLEKFWAFAADPANPDVVHPILVYADLAATLDPRNQEAAQMIRKRYIDDALHTL
jgi:hypothetical protein